MIPMALLLGPPSFIANANDDTGGAWRCCYATAIFSIAANYRSLSRHTGNIS